jgi:hypothetical protein
LTLKAADQKSLAKFGGSSEVWKFGTTREKKDEERAEREREQLDLEQWEDASRRAKK